MIQLLRDLFRDAGDSRSPITPETVRRISLEISDDLEAYLPIYLDLLALETNDGQGQEQLSLDDRPSGCSRSADVDLHPRG